MEIKRLNEINERLKKTDIQGKDYVEVNQRILAFWELYPNGSIETEILSLENGVVTFRATVKDGDKVLSTGHGQEKEGNSFINKTSFIENCETSAVGRALGILGIGATTSIASAEEVANAIKNQDKPVKKAEPKKAEQKEIKSQIDPQTLLRAQTLKIDPVKVAAYNKISIDDLTTEIMESAIKQKTEALAKMKAAREAKQEAESEN